MTALQDASRALPVAVRRLLVQTGTRSVVLSGSKDSNPKQTLLLFPDGAELPTLAVKVASTDAAADSVRREARLLSALHGLDRPTVTAAVPRCLDLVDEPDRTVLVAQAMPGRPMLVDYHEWRHTGRRRKVLQDLALARTWIERLQDRPTGPHRQLGTTACALATAAAGSAPVPDIEVHGVVAELRERLSGASTPQTVVHGDYWCGNLLTTDGAITGVVDWEAGSLVGEPLRDQVRFILSYALYLDRHTRPGRRIRGHGGLRAERWGDGIRHGLLGAGWFSDAVRDFLQDALRHRCLPSGLWFDLALSGVAEICATSDHPGFARAHRDLLVELWGRRAEAPA